MSDVLIKELTEFIQQNDNIKLKIAACENVKGLTSNLTGVEFIIRNRRLLEALLNFNDEEIEEVSDLMLVSLINISAEEVAIDEFHEKEIISNLTKIVCNQTKQSDKCCAILNNISTQSIICKSLLKWKINLKGKELILFDAMFSSFCITSVKMELCTLDHVASVMVNITQTKEGRLYFLSSNAEVMKKTLPFIKFPSVRRRKGVIATIRNCLFEYDYHELLLRSDVELLSMLLSSLMDGHEYTDDENDALPLDLQYLPSETARESVADIRNMIVECLHLLCATSHGRKFLKDNGAYFVLRELYNWETEHGREDIAVQTEKVISILIGDEPEEGMQNLLNLEIPENVKSKLQKFEDES